MVWQTQVSFLRSKEGPVVKEPTSTVFVFRRDDGHWRTALVWHPRLECWIPPGGHVEADEDPAEAAVREVREEAGLAVRLVPGPQAPMPSGFPHPGVCPPWWVVEFRAQADNHTPERHVHVDHVYLALADEPGTVSGAAHEVRWFTAAEAASEPGIAEDSRLQAKELFMIVADLPG